MSTRSQIVLTLTIPEARRLYKVLWRDDAEGPLIHTHTKSIIDALASCGLRPPAPDYIQHTFNNQVESD
jgi:hypothetical protein